jgi:hypothetical protein
VVMLPPGERFSWDFFIDELLERSDEHRSETRKTNRSYGTFLHVGNASPHLAQSKFDSTGIHRLLHLPYVPISHHPIVAFRMPQDEARRDVL